MKKLLLTAQSIFVLGVSTVVAPVFAKDMPSQEDIIGMALPELADELENNAFDKSSGAIRIKCYVDTPAWDHFTYDSCGSVGTAHTTVAVFNLENVPPGSTVNWSHSSCGTSSWCSFPISLYQSITVTATILKPDYTYEVKSGTAHYFGWR